MSKQRILYGAKIEWSFDSGATWATVPEAKGIGVPEESIDYKDATSLDSPDGFEEFIPGMKTAGEVTVECGYTSGCYESAVQQRDAGTLVHFRSTLPVETGQSAGDVFLCTGFVSPSVKQNGLKEIIGLDLKIKVSGKPTFTKGAVA